MALPDNLSYTKMTGRFIRAVTDTLADGDDLPDSVPMVGLSITFTPDFNPPRIKTVASVPPTTITLASISGTTNADGDLVAADGSVGLYLISSDDPDISPRGWTYKVTITGTGFTPVTMSFVAVSNATIDLTTLVPVPANMGSEILIWQAVSSQAQQAANAAAISAAQAAAAAADAEAAADGVADVSDLVDDAEAAAAAAAASATAAANSATASSNSATASAGSATTAAGSVTAAAGQVTLATQQAVAAAASAAQAALEADAAEAAANDAEAAQAAAEAAQAAAEAAAAEAGEGGGGTGTANLDGGGTDGMILKRASVSPTDNIWAPQMSGVQPVVWIQLGGDPSAQGVWWSDEVVGDWANFTYPPEIEPGGPQYAYRSLVKDSITPPLWIYEGLTETEKNGNGVLLWGTGWREPNGEPSGNWSNSAPITANIYVEPVYDMQPFYIEFPLDNWRNGVAPWSHLDLSVQNTTGNGYRADVRFIFLSGTYAGTRVPVGQWYDDPARSGDGDYRKLTLEHDEAISWRIDNVGGEWPAGTRVTPVMSHTDKNGLVVYTGDKYWETNVKGRENTYSFSAGGDLVAMEADATDGHAFYNDKLELQGVSFIRANVGRAPTGSDITLDVRINGVSILTTPLVIPAGQTSGTATPKRYPWPLGSTQITPITTGNTIALAPWAPGQKMTAHILSVGSTTPGANLTLQIWAG